MENEMDKRIKVLLVFGTRPEAIKMAPLIKALSADSRFEPVVCVSAQHREMLDQVLEITHIKPDFDLDIMKKSQSLSYIVSNVLQAVEDVIKECEPDIVLVHGDTATTFAASLAAFYNHVPVGHVEAGLRSFDINSPFPEEANRVLTSRIASIHFAPTVSNRQNLIDENITKDIYVTGNTVIDELKLTVRDDYIFKNEKLRKLDFNKKIIFMTAHRRENLGKPLENICSAVKKLAENFSDITVIYAVHLNPAVQKTARAILSDIPNVLLLEPLDFDETHNLMARSYLVLTDSGGLQEEAPALGKPVLVLRTETERPEAVKAGTVKIAGVDKDVIYNMAAELLENENEYKKMAHAANPYGDGKACERILKALLYFFGRGGKPEDFGA